MKEDANEMKSNGTLTKEPSESGAHYNIFDANYGAWLTSIGQERAILTDEDIAGTVANSESYLGLMAIGMADPENKK